MKSDDDVALQLTIFSGNSFIKAAAAAMQQHPFPLCGSLQKLYGKSSKEIDVVI